MKNKLYFKSLFIILQNQELTKTLVAIRGINGLQHCEGYINGWQTLVSEPFLKLEYTQSQEQIEECIKVVQFLNNCTLVKKLKLKKIIDHCFHLKLHHLAALFLLFLGHCNYDCDREYVLNVSFHFLKLVKRFN